MDTKLIWADSLGAEQTKIECDGKTYQVTIEFGAEQYDNDVMKIQCRASTRDSAAFVDFEVSVDRFSMTEPIPNYVAAPNSAVAENVIERLGLRHVAEQWMLVEINRFSEMER